MPKATLLQHSFPIELLELILVFLWHGSTGLPGGGSLKEARVVNRAWYLTSMRVMMSFVLITSPDELRTYRAIIHSPPLPTPAENALRSGIEDKRAGRWGYIEPAPGNSRRTQKRREKFSFKPLLNRIGSLLGRKRRLKPDALGGGIIGASRTLGEHPALLCRSFECNLKAGCVDSTISWDDILTIIPLLPNLRSFGLRTDTSHPCILHIVEALADRRIASDPSVTCAPDVDTEQPTVDGQTRTKGRTKLEQLDLSIQALQLTHFPLRSRIVFSGLQYLSIQGTDLQFIGSLIRASVPGTLRTLHLSGPINLTSPDIAPFLAQRARAGLRELILVSSGPSYTTPAMYGERPPMIATMEQDLVIWRIVELLEQHPMVGLGRLCIDASEGTSDSIEEFVRAHPELQGYKGQLLEACRKSHIQFDTSVIRQC